MRLVLVLCALFGVPAVGCRPAPAGSAEAAEPVVGDLDDVLPAAYAELLERDEAAEHPADRADELAEVGDGDGDAAAPPELVGRPEDRGPPARPFDGWTREPPEVSLPQHPPEPDGPLEVFEGRRVVAVETFHADGALRRRRYVLAGQPRNKEIDHGPDWTWHANGELASVRTWFEGRQQGLYVSWYPIGTPDRVGHFEADAGVGVWARWDQAGRLIFVQEMRNGLLHGGRWRWWVKGQRPQSEAYWVDGRADGVQRTWTKSGVLEEERSFSDGVAQGSFTEWHRNGQAKLAGTFEAGEQHGLWTHWGVLGRKLSEEPWDHGVLHGVSRRWSPAGQLVLEQQYEHGKVDGVAKQWWPNGNPRSEVTYALGVPHGRSVSWYEDEQIQVEGDYADGAREGLWTYWNPDGTVDEAWTGRYEADRRVDRE